jgi:hypothetical protein
MEERKRQAPEERKASRQRAEVDLGRAWSRRPAAAWSFSAAASSPEMMAHETEAQGDRFPSRRSMTTHAWADARFLGLSR